MRGRESASQNMARDIAKRRAQESSHGGGGARINLPDGVSFFKNDGKTVELDFIPYTINNALNPDVRAGRVQVGYMADALMYKQHVDIGASQEKYICPTTFGKPCPICEAYAEAKKKGTMDKDELKALRPKERMLYNVIDAKDKSGAVQIWDVSYHLFTKQLEHEQEEHEEYYSYWFPEAGYTLRIRFEKKSIDRGEPFYEADRIDFTERNPLTDDDLKQAVDLDACLQVLSYEKLEAIFLGVENEPEARPEVAEPIKVERTARATTIPTQTEPPARSTRGRVTEDTIHDKAPDAPAERERAGRHPIDPAQDCPGGGEFGVDIDKLDHCYECDKWDACKDERDALKQKEKTPTKQPTEISAPARRTGRR